MTALGEDAARRLLSRAGYGPRRGTLAEAARQPRGEWLDAQLALPAESATVTSALAAHTMPIRYVAGAGEQMVDEQRPLFALAMTPEQRWAMTDNRAPIAWPERDRPRLELSAATLLRKVLAPDQLRERAVEFWHDHFSVAAQASLPVSVSLPDHDARIRAHAFGNFAQLLEAMASSPAMLAYLNNNTSRAGAPNENFARELLELHTLGAAAYHPGARSWRDVPGAEHGSPAGYFDGDVWEAARAFTGWTIAGGQRIDAAQTLPRAGTFAYVERWHDGYQKRVLGQEFTPFAPALADGRRVISLLATHPATARHLSPSSRGSSWAIPPRPLQLPAPKPPSPAIATPPTRSPARCARCSTGRRSPTRRSAACAVRSTSPPPRRAPSMCRSRRRRRCSPRWAAPARRCSAGPRRMGRRWTPRIISVVVRFAHAGPAVRPRAELVADRRLAALSGAGRAADGRGRARARSGPARRARCGGRSAPGLRLGGGPSSRSAAQPAGCRRTRRHRPARPGVPDHMIARIGRRALLRAGLATAALPGLRGMAFADTAGGTPLLILVFLRGGMDGLHFLSPADDAAFVDMRVADLRTRADGPGAGHRLDAHAGADFRLHPEAAGLAEIWRDRRLAIWPAAGLPDPTRSHFEAQSLMAGARGTRQDPRTQQGWLAAWTAALAGNGPGPAAIAGQGGLTPELVGQSRALALPSLAGGLAIPAGALAPPRLRRCTPAARTRCHAPCAARSTTCARSTRCSRATARTA